MKKEDFERITHITMALGFIPYTQLICSLHMDLAVELEEHEEREREIYLEYPEYYDDEEIYEKYDKWISNYKEGKVLVIDVDNLDFVENKEDLGFIFNKIEGEINGLF